MMKGHGLNLDHIKRYNAEIAEIVEDHLDIRMVESVKQLYK